MAIITLTTDFGVKDYSVGAVKGAIYSELQEAKVVDISHNVSPFNISEAAYIIKNAFHCFPKGSIHIIGVESEFTIENKHIVVELDGHIFICANNGIMSMICSESKPSQIIEIDLTTPLKSSFPVLDVFVKVACHIARGGSLSLVGKSISEIKPISHLLPFVNKEQDQIIGTIIYVDNYGNVVSNITKAFFKNMRANRDFEISARNYKFTVIRETYSDIVNFETKLDKRDNDGKALALFNHGGYLEISVYKSNCSTVGSAATLMGLKPSDTITITFIN